VSESDEKPNERHPGVAALRRAAELGVAGAFRRTMRRAALILPIFLSACAQLKDGEKPQPLDAAPSAAQLREWSTDECVRAGKRVGIDYPSALGRAIRQEPAGLAELFRYTVTGGMDGEAGEAHSAILFGLLQRWGDGPFAQVLRAQKRQIRKAVIDNLPMPPESRGKYPLTYGSAAH